MNIEDCDVGLEAIKLLIKLLESNECNQSQINKENPMNIKKKEIPIWEKKYITIYEAMEYTNIGDNNLRRILNKPNCDFVVYLGNQKLINRQKLEEYLDDLYSL